MRKIVNPCLCETYRGFNNAFVKIEYNEGKLSICGVIGPRSNGNCDGSAGQCVEEIRKGTPKEGWSREMIDKLCNIWDEWHLNDMNPCCQHQKALGWKDQAKEEMTLYHYRLTREAQKAKKEAEASALAALVKGDPFAPTAEQTFFASLPYAADIFGSLEDKLVPHYEPKKSLYPGDAGFTEKKTRGWVRYGECEQGILCKPCPVCGYKYGTAWIKEEVPQDVIDWLFDLPDTAITPAWV